ncbi:34776_t:CDS:2 [Gigaspora margarita]|uniref:34776_t:CDS:1 n=1 Tax=Gigaspora margarita TaxID=4874 RepID=A0ABN7W8Z2_GIGMA|nr:34776_t:CDS:2 [Gigaspora margarita]
MNYKIFWTIFSSYLLAFAIFADAHNYETPKDKISICCKAPVLHKHQDCVQWDFGQNTCLLVGNELLGQELSADPVKTCGLVTGPPTRGTDAGIIRCSDGCIPKLRKYWKHHDKN